MSAMANTTPIVTTVTKPATNPRDADATPRVNIQDFCEEYYEDILPTIMDKVRRDKRKEVHARLDFEEGSKERRTREDSHYSSARALTARPERLKVRDRLRYSDRHMLDRLGHRRQSAFDRLNETYSPSTTKSRPGRTNFRDHPHGRSHPHRLDASNEGCPEDRERFCGVGESYDDSHSHSYYEIDHSRHMKRGRDSESPLSSVSKSDSSDGRSLSPYNGIIGRPRIKEIQAVLSTAREMLKFPVDGAIVTIRGIFTRSAKEKGSGPEHAKAIQAKVQKLVEAGIMREVYYHDWLSNPVMVKKHDGSWRMCVDFTDLNKACPQDCYPLPEIEWKVESLCGYPFKCFLDAYKGYHQIQLAESDKEKTAFHTRQGVYCYTKMPFGLKNAGAMYERLVDKAFDSQIGLNTEVYVDDLVVKSHTEAKMLRDIGETFRMLRKINMNLNPKKCTFGAVEGMFLGYMVTPEGIKSCPDKTEAVLQLPSPQTIKEVQSLNGKLDSLNRFLSKSAEKSLPQFETLKKYIKKSDFHWTPKAEQAFKQLKQHLSELPLLVAPKPKEELIVCLFAFYGAISAVLMTERGTGATKRLRRYFQAHPIAVITDQPIKQIMSRPDVAGRLQKWSVMLGEHNITYRPRTSMKGQVLADFLANFPDESQPDASLETQQEPWTLFTDESSCVDGSNAGLILTSPEGTEFTYALRFQFAASNNEAEYEALIAGLQIATQMGEGGMKASYQGLTVRIIRGGPLQAVIPYNVVKPLTPITAPWTFYKWGIDIACPFPEGPGNVKFWIVSMDYFTKWIEAKAVATITGSQVKKFVWDNIVCRFGLPGEIVLDNSEQFSDNPFKDWCDKLNITQRFASVKHPQSNGIVKRANQSLGEGIKARLGEGNKNWVEELPHVLWAHRTMIKSSHGNTPFLFTYGTEAVIPAEIGMPTYRTAAVDVVHNDEELRLNLDLLEERRERFAIRKAKAKAKLKMKKYYNARVRGVTFRPGDFVYRSNDASHVVDGGKLGSK
nr:reverse transcriptase domain-containing protein [Tanacetum cinerariifolium]